LLSDTQLFSIIYIPLCPESECFITIIYQRSSDQSKNRSLHQWPWPFVWQESL